MNENMLQNFDLTMISVHGVENHESVFIVTCIYTSEQINISISYTVEIMI